MHARVIGNKPVRVALRERIDLELVRSLTKEPPSEVSGLPPRQRVARLIPHRGTLHHYQNENGGQSRSYMGFGGFGSSFEPPD